MPGIVSDTTPLNYLVLIGAIDVLPRLYQRVLIPPAVKAELSVPEAPALVSAWIATAPSWLEILACSKIMDPDLARLDPGEREAIFLATEQGMSLLLMDERDGSAAARARGLTVIGTLSALDAAAARGWLDLPEMFKRLSETSFRSPGRLMASMLAEHARRSKKQE
ncbi:MAG TPA: DUF3368 domain-containing protein [Candidatus Dormibacteraeota bacterium]|nr:DUF3368 domain-containing protein [Candidatus Dormibacteraeota bacterium]